MRVAVTALKSIRIQAFQILFWHLMIIIGLVIFLLILKGTWNSFSALLGGLAYWLPTMIFIWRVLARANVRAAQQFVLAFFAGEAVKLLLSGVLFLLVVKYLSVNIQYAFIGFMGAIIAFWVAAVFSFSRRQGVGL